ncbi:hypothetical protein CBOM_00372 [Ceraceosorus bombacis]|uniref:Uncharacterized protein n=1 Tax=Ceraceosorus bombacis TaxID=401625 RepID=A0A0P1B9R2_9BASI|nr:hypothetical protein CBOM_00372 [Ceraceosorus bombacis]
MKASATGETTEDLLQIERERLEAFMAEVEKRFVFGDPLIPKYLYDDCDFDEEWDRHERDKDERGANAAPARDSEERWFDEEEESSLPDTKSDARYSPDF